jgi:hypothetical protein
MARKKKYDYEAEKTKVTFSNERMNPNSSYNQNSNVPHEEEVNPEVREDFEAKYGKGNKFGKDGKGYKDEEAYKAGEKGTEVDKGYTDFLKTHKEPININPFNKKPTETEDEKRALYEASVKSKQEGFKITGEDIALAAGTTLGMGASITAFGTLGTKGVAGAFGTAPAKAVEKTVLSIAGKAINSPLGKVAVLGMSADQLTNWYAMDNIAGGASILIRDLKGKIGSATPQERQMMIAQAEEAKENAEIAMNKVRISTIVDPASWPFAKLWITGNDQKLKEIEYNLNYMRNYDPYMDQWSNESRGQRY